MSHGGKEWAKPQVEAGSGLRPTSHPLSTQSRGRPVQSFSLDPLYLPPAPAGIRPRGSWLGFVEKDYPDQSHLISAPACTLPTFTRTPFPATLNSEMKSWVLRMGHVSASHSGSRAGC